MKDFNDCCIDCVITSPPYWGLRDYKTEGQLGLEPTFQEYINKLMAIFDQIKRVLKKEGTCWVILGDTYNGNTKGNHNRSNHGSHEKWNLQPSRPNNNDLIKPISKDIEEKSLLMIPQRFAIAMLDHGWILRNDIIWYKPNCMPSSATDRFTVDYEHIFFFTKSQNYYFETQYEQFGDKPRWGGDIMRIKPNHKQTGNIYGVRHMKENTSLTPKDE